MNLLFSQHVCTVTVSDRGGTMLVTEMASPKHQLWFNLRMGALVTSDKLTWTMTVSFCLSSTMQYHLPTTSPPSSTNRAARRNTNNGLRWCCFVQSFCCIPWYRLHHQHPNQTFVSTSNCQGSIPQSPWPTPTICRTFCVSLCVTILYQL